MNKKPTIPFIISHILLAVLLIVIFLPGAKQTESPVALLAAIFIMESYHLLQLFLAQKKDHSLDAPSDIMCFIWAFLLIWEILCTKTAVTHPILIPAPENVFHVFPTQYPVLLAGIWSSLELLIIGIVLGIGFGILLGIPAGWLPRLRNALAPIANVLSPIPPIVYAPYIIALMPTFRQASILTVVLGVFFPTFLNMIIRVSAIDRDIMETAISMNISNLTMFTKILFPYVLPSVISGLKVTTTTSIILLFFAEMMGATSGMGYYIINYNTYGNYTNVVAGIIVIMLVITLLNRIISLIQKKAIKWQ